MKNTRKKVLLSSVAMLLVALVALGSATYAWFTISKSVTATGMQLTAQTEAGLEISKTVGYADNTFDATTVAFTDTYDTLNLVSVDTSSGSLGTAYFAGNVSEAGTWTAKTSSKINDFKAVPSAQNAATALTAPASGDNTNGTKYFAAYAVKVRSKAGGSGTAVTRTGFKGKVTITGAGADYVRVAVMDGNTVVATYGSESTPKAIISTTPTTETQSLTTSGTAVTLNSGSIDGTGKEYKFLCWFEGEDGEAINTNANSAATIAVEFSYTD